MHEALRQHQQAGTGDDDQYGREHHGAAGRHHRAPDRRFGVVALGYLFSEPAHHEKSVVDRDTQTDQRDHRLGEEVHRPEQGGEAQDARRSGDAQATHDDRQTGGDHPAEHEEQHHRHQRQRQHLHALLVGGDSPGQRAGDRLQAGDFDLAAVELLQVRLGSLEILEDGVVVVALDLDRGKRVLLLRVGHGGERFGISEVADPAHDLIGVVILDLVQPVLNRVEPFRVVDRLALGCGEDCHHMARAVPAVDLVADD